MLLETVLLSKHIFSTHHPSGFPLARLTSFSFVPVLSFCLKMAKNDQKHHFNQGFSTSQEKWHTSLSCLQLTIAKHSGNIRLHSGVCLLVVREKTGAGCMREALEAWFFLYSFLETRNILFPVADAENAECFAIEKVCWKPGTFPIIGAKGRVE